MRRSLLEPEGDVEEGVANSAAVQQLQRGVLEDQRSRVELLVDPVAEALEPEPALLVPGQREGLVDRHLPALDGLEHLDDGNRRAAVHGPPQRADPRGARGEQVCLARADNSHRRRAAPELMVGVQYQDQIQSIHDLRGGDILLQRLGEQHVQEVARVG